MNKPPLTVGGLAVPIVIFDEPKQPEKPKELSSEVCVRLFGAREAVMMNFVPQMLTALALEQAEAFISYCSANRLSEYKRHSREMHRCIDEYNRELRKSYSASWSSYQYYLSRLRETVAADLFRCWCTFTNEAARQYVGHPHKDLPARVALARMLFVFVEEFDKNVDKVITRRLSCPCNRRQYPFTTLLTALLVDIADTFGQKMEITSPMSLCVKVLANRCREVVDVIMAEEDVAELTITDKC